MKTLGLFTRQDLQTVQNKPKRGEQSLAGASLETLHRLGPGAIAGMNPKAKHPRIAPAGKKHPVLYILGDCPSEVEDRCGKHWAGAAGSLLRKQIPEEYRAKVRFNYLVPTLPPNGRPLKLYEIECCRKAVIQDIERARPSVVLACGQGVINWVARGVCKITATRGRYMPVKIGDHVCWLYVVQDPHDIQRILLERNDQKDRNPGIALAKLFKRDMKFLFRDLKQGLPKPRVVSKKDVFKNLKLIHGGNSSVAGVEKLLKRYSKFKRIAIDIETNKLRPFNQGAKLLCISFGTEDEACSIAIDHPQAQWNPTERDAILKLIGKFLLNKVEKICHNAKMEMEWFAFIWGRRILRSCVWHDTMVQAYVLDERVGGKSLNFCALRTLGLSLKELSSEIGIGSRGEVENKIDRSRLEQIDIQRVLKYNALDSKYTEPVWRKQQQELKSQGMVSVYRRQLRRLPTLVSAQLKGFPIDQDEIRHRTEEIEAKIRKQLRIIETCREVRIFKNKYGAFNPNSNQHLTLLFKDILKERAGWRNKKYSVDESTLKAIDSKFSRALLLYKKAAKFLSTYINPLDVTVKDTHVFEDQRIHPMFNDTNTDTGRLSAEDPSVQNYPKRNAETKVIRKAFVAPGRKRK